VHNITPRDRDEAYIQTGLLARTEIVAGFSGFRRASARGCEVKLRSGLPAMSSSFNAGKESVHPVPVTLLRRAGLPVLVVSFLCLISLAQTQPQTSAPVASQPPAASESQNPTSAPDQTPPAVAASPAAPATDTPTTTPAAPPADGAQAPPEQDSGVFVFKEAG
jgi:hypothetical protein